MGTKNRRRQPISGRRVAAVLLGVVAATAVVPPAAAWRLNQSRIERAARVATAIAQHLRAERADVSALAERTDVVCGFGRVPKAGPSGAPWLNAPMTVQDVFGPSRPTDPWGRCYLLNAGSLSRGEPVLVLSAGPNGFIDTPIGAPEPAADDVGARVW
jgi:hypothetical protein